METNTIGSRQTRNIPGQFRAMEDDSGNQYIEGYFAVFNSDYQIAPDMSESIAPGAFDNTLADDVRCLTDHDTRLVLGRTSAHTLEIRQDEHGLWGRVLINTKDQDAVNTKARVDRGDVNQASFGFDIVKEDTDIREDGSVHWTIRDVKLYEVSVCTFPAYEETNLSARSAQRDEALHRGNDAWKEKAKAKLKGETNGSESIDASQEDRH